MHLRPQPKPAEPALWMNWVLGGLAFAAIIAGAAIIAHWIASALLGGGL